MRWFVPGIALLLAGCAATPDQVAMNATDDQSCRSAGAIPGTAVYSRCREEMEMQRQAPGVQRLRRALDRIGNPPQVYDVTVSGR